MQRRHLLLGAVLAAAVVAPAPFMGTHDGLARHRHRHRHRGRRGGGSASAAASVNGPAGSTHVEVDCGGQHKEVSDPFSSSVSCG
jgi:hypothetical protein